MELLAYLIHIVDKLEGYQTFGEKNKWMSQILLEIYYGRRLGQGVALLDDKFVKYLTRIIIDRKSTSMKQRKEGNNFLSQSV